MLSKGRFYAVVLILALAACQEPSIEINFEIPLRYQSLVSHVTLEVFVPPENGPFSCEELAYSDVDDQLLEASLVAELGPGESKFHDVDRKKTKLFVARGFTEQDIPAVVGCSEIGEVSDTKKVTISGEPTSTASPPENHLLFNGSTAGLATELSLSVKDILDEPIPNASFKWTTVGSTGERFDGTERCDISGEITFVPEQTQLPGPAVLDIRLRWQRNPLPLVNGFKVPSDPLFETLVPQIEPNPEPGCIHDSVVANLGSFDSKEHTFAILYQVDHAGPSNTAQFHLMVITYDKDSESLMHTTDITVDLGEDHPSPGSSHDKTCMEGYGASTPPLALGTFMRDGREHIIVLSAQSWFELKTQPIFHLQKMEFFSPSVDKVPTSVVSMDSCYPESSDSVLLVSYSGQQGVAYDSSGSPVNHPFQNIWPSDDQKILTGCVSDSIEEFEHPAFVEPIGTDAFQLNILLNGAQDLWTTRFDEWTYSFTFSPRLSEEEPSSLVVGQLDFDGMELARLKFNSQDPIDESWVQRYDGDPLAATPRAFVGGDIDPGNNNDPMLDLAGLVSIPSPDSFGDSSEPRHIHAIIGTKYKGVRVAGSFSIDDLFVGIIQPESQPKYRLWLVDFDKNGADDMVVIQEGTSIDGTTPMGGFAVYLMGE